MRSQPLVDGHRPIAGCSHNSRCSDRYCEHPWSAFSRTGTDGFIHVHRSIYKAFGNKHDLYVRVFSDYCQGLVAQAREELREGPHAVLTSPMARLERYVVSLADGPSPVMVDTLR
ncbi:hypothetical protein QFZ22_009654 [Streptomyces canus]|uniref:Uncharacterized protein n=1 Tax=Streptomyces canus TaxID=58343 RepID=A0AAW8FX21_9ACTN|nr:TetR/AcrR family transcriptional regulator [Streptomyces canus]MDQ0913582.1 hypothetical protein [Streptomyces canus]